MGGFSAAWAQEVATSSTLDTVVVTASSAEESKREVSSNITVITAKDIKKSTAKDLGQLLNQNGFQTYTTSGNGGGGTTLYIRGIGNSSMNNELEGNTLILLNGHRTGNSSLNLKDLGNVERIEIIRGPAAVQYGTAALGGVINVITKRGEEGFSAGAELGVGSYNRFDQKLNLSGGKGGFDFSGAVTNTRADDYETGAGDIWKHTRVDDRLGIDLDAGYTFLENHRLGVHFNYFNMNNGELPGGGWPDTSLWSNNFGTNDDAAHNATFTYEGGTEDRLFTWAANYTFGQYKAKSLSYTDSNYPGAWLPIFYPEPSGWGDNTTDFQQGQARVTFDNNFVMLTAGFDTIQYELDNRASWGDSKSKSTDYAGYLLGKLRLFDDRVILSAGGRYDSYKVTDELQGRSQSDNHFSPSVGLAWLPADFLKLRVNYAEGFHMPSALQMVGNQTYYPNPSLKPEKAQSFEVGADVSWKFIDGSLTYFHTNFKDKIVARTVRPWPAQPSSIYENFNGKAVYSGFEIALGADLGQAFDQPFELRPYANMTIMTKRENSDKTNFVPQDPGTLPYVPKMTASYGVDFDSKDLGLLANVNATYIGKAYQNDWNYVHNPFYAPMYVYYGGFTVVDLSLEKALYSCPDYGEVSLRAEVNNLFDKDYAYVMDYPMPGRNFYLGLKYAY